MSVVARPGRRRRGAHRTMPLVVGLALLSMAGLARYGPPAALTGVLPAVARAAPGTASVEVSTVDVTSLPAGLVPGVDEARAAATAVVGPVRPWRAPDVRAAAAAERVPSGPAVSAGSAPRDARTTPVAARRAAPAGSRAPPAG
jgi:hypothetical protein